MKSKKNVKKRITRFEKIAFSVLVFSICFYVVGIICIKSKEAELNVTSQKIERQISATQTSINALNLSIENKTKLSYLKEVASARGYQLRSNSEITAYVDVGSDE